MHATVENGGRVSGKGGNAGVCTVALQQQRMAEIKEELTLEREPLCMQQWRMTEECQEREEMLERARLHVQQRRMTEEGQQTEETLQHFCSSINENEASNDTGTFDLSFELTCNMPYCDSSAVSLCTILGRL